MLILILATITIVALSGLAVKYILEYRNSELSITWREYAIGMAISPVVATLVALAGWSLSKSGQLNFTEYLNGWEIEAIKIQVTCSKDGPCRWEYDCEPYQVPYECNCTEDDDGNESCDTCYRTEYHDCPYVKQEFNYVVKTTLGDHTIASNVFPENPQRNRWTDTDDYENSIPNRIVSSAGTGDPAFWVDVRNRCQANQPGPVTARNNYLNYILASDRTLMREHSSDIAEYQKRNLLPELVNNVESFYHANKVSFVGMKPGNNIVWQNALEYLNASLGRELQGDMYLVVIKDDSVSVNPDRYSMALKAYWQDKERFGDDVLSKNGLVVILGTADGSTVAWSRAFTGMPLGNEKLIVVMRDGLKGQSLNPASLLGPLVSQRRGSAVAYPPNGQYGPIQKIIFGIDDPATKFKRISMSGDDGQGGYLYLKNEIQPTTGQIWSIMIIALLLCSVAWVWAANHYDTTEGRRRRRL
jgi:hypothetical protein